MLQDKLGLMRQRHTEITGYTIGAQTHTNPRSTNNFAYLTGRNFGLVRFGYLACDGPANDFFNVRSVAIGPGATALTALILRRR